MTNIKQDMQEENNNDVLFKDQIYAQIEWLTFGLKRSTLAREGYSRERWETWAGMEGTYKNLCDL